LQELIQLGKSTAKKWDALDPEGVLKQLIKDTEDPGYYDT
jgi:hypothetical protein